MKTQIRNAAIALGLAVGFQLAAATFAPRVLAHELHVNESHRECDIQFAANLSQTSFARFTREAGDIVILKNSGTSVLPARRVELGLGYFSTPINQHSDTWNDTFSHPNDNHPLGDAISVPAIYARVGLGLGMDVAGYFTRNPLASYRFAGVGLKYELPWTPPVTPELAASLDYGTLFGPDDTTIHALGADLHASRSWKAVTAYASTGVTWAYGIERSRVVDLDNENTVGPHGTIGVAPRVGSIVQLDLSARFASVNSFELKLGHIF